MAGPCAALLRAPERRRIRLVREPAWVVADQSSRGAGSTEKNLYGRAGLCEERILRGYARTGNEVARPGSERTGVDGKRYAGGTGGTAGRQDDGGGIHQAQIGDRRDRAREHAENRPAFRRGDAISGRRILALPIQ